MGIRPIKDGLKIRIDDIHLAFGHTVYRENPCWLVVISERQQFKSEFWATISKSLTPASSYSPKHKHVERFPCCWYMRWLSTSQMSGQNFATTGKNCGRKSIRPRVVGGISLDVYVTQICYSININCVRRWTAFSLVVFHCFGKIDSRVFFCFNRGNWELDHGGLYRWRFTVQKAGKCYLNYRMNISSAWFTSGFPGMTSQRIAVHHLEATSLVQL